MKLFYEFELLYVELPSTVQGESVYKTAGKLQTTKHFT